MDAYQELGTNKSYINQVWDKVNKMKGKTPEEMAQIRITSLKRASEEYDEKIERTAKNLLIFRLGDIKKIITGATEYATIEQSLKDSLASMMAKINAYQAISTEQKRGIYASQGEKDITEVTVREIEELGELTFRDGKNAFEINRRQPIPIDKLILADSSNRDIEIYKNFREYVLELLKDIPAVRGLDPRKKEQIMREISMERLSEIASELEKQMWAYSKISTYSKRQQYLTEISKERTREYYKKVGELAKGARILTTAERGPEVEKRKKTTKMVLQIGKESVQISKTGYLNYGMYFRDEELGEYTISRPDGSQHRVFSNIKLDEIDSEGIKNDIRYREKIAYLLSNTSIELSEECLGGYLGILPGQNPEDIPTRTLAAISACKKYQEKYLDTVMGKIKARQEREKRRQGKNNPRREDDQGR